MAAIPPPRAVACHAAAIVQGKDKPEGEEMDADMRGLHWFKSSASAVGNCVEVAHMPSGGVAVRDSKDRGKAAHVYTRSEWEAFLVGAKNGEFDLPRS